MRQSLLIILFSVFVVWPCFTQASDRQVHGCKQISFQTVLFTVCTFNAAKDDIRLFHSTPNGVVHKNFANVARFLTQQGYFLRFAMNAGMYHQDYGPVGLYVEDGMKRKVLNRKTGSGNFFLQPNGVFYLEDGRAGVLDTTRFKRLKSHRALRYATQSGPMLVIKGKLHPAFSATGRSKFKRNGVGVMSDGRTVHFVISEASVNFHTFARVFRDVLKTPNALYLDGYVSQLYAPELGRHDYGPALGPIIGVVESTSKQKQRTQ